jgi:hypothetical protein
VDILLVSPQGNAHAQAAAQALNIPVYQVGRRPLMVASSENAAQVRWGP